MTSPTDSEWRNKRDAAIRTQDEVIAAHLAQAFKSGELQSAESFGKPLKEPAGYAETPDEFRLAFKILKNAGVTPPEVELFHKRARLRVQVEAAINESERKALQRQLSELEQLLALRLEGMRTGGKL